MHTVESLQRFEQEIADIYATGSIPHPVHLRSSEDGSYENGMLTALATMKKEDYFFGYWDSHIACLLKGVPEDELEAAIVRGDSIALCFPEYRILCSGIVGSLMGVAVGTAWAIKKAGGTERVYLYSGDMSAKTGIFNEAIKYAMYFDLPISFIVGDNGISVMTNTEETWGTQSPAMFSDFKYSEFEYKNKWPHSGLKTRIKF